jgi:hypothetical protein
MSVAWFAPNRGCADASRAQTQEAPDLPPRRQDGTAETFAAAPRDAAREGLSRFRLDSADAGGL